MMQILKITLIWALNVLEKLLKHPDWWNILYFRGVGHGPVKMTHYYYDYYQLFSL